MSFSDFGLWEDEGNFSTFDFDTTIDAANEENHPSLIFEEESIASKLLQNDFSSTEYKKITEIAPRNVRLFIQKWMQSKDERLIYLLPVNLPRPPFSYLALACFAIINSPTNYVTLHQVYYFILHHFRYYRYLDESWKGSVRTVLARQHCIEEREVNGKPGEKPLKVFSLVKNFQVRRVMKAADWSYIEKSDPRGVEFYNRLLNGAVGLPRQLFYQVVGIFMPIFAGPENSALFYHLIAIKQVPAQFAPLFREYWLREHSGKEPKFIEPYLAVDQRHTKCLDNMPAYGAALEFEEEPRVMTQQDLADFHDNVEAYFDLQKQYHEQGVEHWETPRRSEVELLAADGNDRRDYFMPRDAKDLPPGSLIEKKSDGEQPDSFRSAIEPCQSFSNLQYPEDNLGTNLPECVQTNQSEWFVVGMKKRFKRSHDDRVAVEGTVIKYRNVIPPSVRQRLTQSPDFSNDHFDIYRNIGNSNAETPMSIFEHAWAPYQLTDEPEWIDDVSPVPIKKPRVSSFSQSSLGSIGSSTNSRCSSPDIEWIGPVGQIQALQSVPSEDFWNMNGPPSPSRISIW